MSYFQGCPRGLMRGIVLYFTVEVGTADIILSSAMLLARFSPASAHIQGPGKNWRKSSLSSCCSREVGAKVFECFNGARLFSAQEPQIGFEGWNRRLMMVQMGYLLSETSTKWRHRPLVQELTMSRQCNWALSQVQGSSECGALWSGSSPTPIKPAINR